MFFSIFSFPNQSFPTHLLRHYSWDFQPSLNVHHSGVRVGWWDNDIPVVKLVFQPPMDSKKKIVKRARVYDQSSTLEAHYQSTRKKEMSSLSFGKKKKLQFPSQLRRVLGIGILLTWLQRSVNWAFFLAKCVLTTLIPPGCGVLLHNALRLV